MKHTLSEEGKSCLSEHDTFDELDFRHLTFDLSIMNGKS